MPWRAAERAGARAQGSGRRARELGLVDRAGGLSDALRVARERGHLPDDAPVTVWPQQRALVDWVADALGGGRDGADALSPWGVVGGWSALLRAMPQAAQSLARLAALVPLAAGGEHVVVALPFALDLR